MKSSVSGWTAAAPPWVRMEPSVKTALGAGSESKGWKVMEPEKAGSTESWGCSRTVARGVATQGPSQGSQGRGEGGSGFVPSNIRAGEGAVDGANQRREVGEEVQPV